LRPPRACPNGSNAANLITHALRLSSRHYRQHNTSRCRARLLNAHYRMQSNATQRNAAQRSATRRHKKDIRNAVHTKCEVAHRGRKSAQLTARGIPAIYCVAVVCARLVASSSKTTVANSAARWISVEHTPANQEGQRRALLCTFRGNRYLVRYLVPPYACSASLIAVLRELDEHNQLGYLPTTHRLADRQKGQ
jgi:hypothetical protein